MSHLVAEIVTFTLAENVSNARFVELSKASEAFVREQEGFVLRQLSQGSDGRWTDYVIWQDMETAQRVAKTFPEQGFATDLMAAIHPESVEMRHETVLWDMAA